MSRYNQTEYCGPCGRTQVEITSEDDWIAPTVELAQVGPDVGAGEALRRWRVSHDILQQQMAHMLGITQGQLSRFETGQSLLSVTQRWCLVEALGLSPDEMGLTRPLPRRARRDRSRPAGRHLVAVR